MLEASSLFVSVKERLWALALLLVVFILSLLFEYHTYAHLNKKRFVIKAYVLNQYEKKGHQVLKLRAKEGFTFYTTSKEDLKDLRGRRVEIMLFHSKHDPSFWEYLHTFYKPGYILKLLPKDLKERMLEAIYYQHRSDLAKELFGALFLAAPVKQAYRQMLASYGISHLLAISGFHIGLLFGVLSFILYWSLFPLYQRFWPYRNLKRTAFLLAFGVVLVYGIFLGFIPSVIRSLAMLLLALIFLDRHIKLFSFESLFWVVAVLVAFWPKLFFSIGFWFSVAGVFYIYLYVRHFSFRGWISFVGLNIWVYLAMLPLSLYVFGQFSFTSLLSPLLSMAFVIFYPLSLIAHLFGVGGWMDWAVEFLSQGAINYHFHLPFLSLLWYLLFTLLAIRRAHYLAYGAFGVVLIYYIA